MSLKQSYAKHFKTGAAVSRKTLAAKRDLVLREFNSLTCENAMKFGALTRDGVNYDFAEADFIRDFARENGMTLRGHTLVWHNQQPEAVFKNNPTREKLITAMKKHIDTMAERYGADVFCWDVVNEAVYASPGIAYRDSPWYEIIGADCYDIAFRHAREVMPPGTLLCYNDHAESVPDKCKVISRNTFHNTNRQGKVPSVKKFYPDNGRWIVNAGFQQTLIIGRNSS